MYAKLFSRITESSIIEESITTRWVFVALLAISDQDGTVIGTDVAIARRINVPLEEFQSSMKVLMSPDKDSNNTDYEGKRVLPSQCERGYFLTGYEKYKSIKTEEERRAYMRSYMKDYRDKKDAPVNSVNNLLTPLTHIDIDTSKNKPTNKDKSKPGVNGEYSEAFELFWSHYPKKVGKGGAWRSWIKINPSEALVSKMVASVTGQSNTDQWKKEGGQFIPNPETWLNQRRWDDEGVVNKKISLKDDPFWKK